MSPSEFAAELAEWREGRLSTLLERTEQVDPVQLGSQFCYIDVSAVSGETLRIEKYASLNTNEAPSRARKLVRAGDVIFATIRPYLKQIAKIPEHLDGQICSTAFCVLRANPSIADPVFIFQAVSSDSFVQKVCEYQTGSNYPAVSDKVITDQRISIPPLPEQRRIAMVLATVDEAIAATDAVITHGEQFRQAVLIAAFNRTLAVSGADHREKWQEIRLGDCGQWRGGLTPSMNKPRYWEGGHMPWITPKDMRRPTIVDAEDHITELAIRETGLKTLPAHSVIFVVRGMILAKRFPVAITTIPSTINQDMRGIIPNEKIDGFYLLYALQNEATSILSLVKTATHGTKKLDSPELKEWFISAPPLQIQRRIATIISTIDDCLALERAERDRLVALKKALMQVLLTGKVRVPPGMAEGVAPAHA